MEDTKKPPASDEKPKEEEGTTQEKAAEPQKEDGKVKPSENLPSAEGSAKDPAATKMESQRSQGSPFKENLTKTCHKEEDKDGEPG